MSNVILCVLDGWGHSESTDFNAIYTANPIFFNKLLDKYPNCILEASGIAVGLPYNQMGNSEIGHMTIGAGHIIENDFIRLNRLSKDFSQSQKLLELLYKASGNIHIFGLFSDGGVHCHVEHIVSMYKFIKNFYSEKNKRIEIYTHAVTDGRDTEPYSAGKYFSIYKDCNIQTVSGRYYAMDRDNRLDRTRLAYNAIVNGESDIIFNKLEDLVSKFYSEGISDEFFLPSIKAGYNGAKDGDTFIIMNFRSDRVRQIITELIDDQETHINKPKIHLLGMKKYFDNCNFDYILDEISISTTLGRIISEAGLKQLRIAETEKYPHVTYFFNGGKELILDGEDRIMIDSPKVATYDLQPEMSAKILTDKLIEAINSNKYNFILANYANADMVGHTGNFDATVKAIQCLDTCLQRFIILALEKKYSIIITSDHGNADNMYNSILNVKNTSHTLNVVPFIVVSNDEYVNNSILQNGNLSNIAKTVLDIMKLKDNHTMNNSLFNNNI